MAKEQVLVIRVRTCLLPEIWKDARKSVPLAACWVTRRGLRPACGPAWSHGTHAGEPNVDFSRRLEPGGHVPPIPNVPDGLEELGFPVLVLQVVRVLPSIEHQERDAGLGRFGVVVVDLRGDEASTDRFPNQGTPSRTHHGVGGLRELTLELLEAAEVAIDRPGELAVRSTSPVRHHVLPKDRVKNVPPEVESE